MLHPSYTDLMQVVNSEVEQGETPVVNSRYSIVMATAKRARQIIAGEANVTPQQASKPLSTAVKELQEGKIKIMPELPEEETAAVESTAEEMTSEEIAEAAEANEETGAEE